MLSYFPHLGVSIGCLHLLYKFLYILSFEIFLLCACLYVGHDPVGLIIPIEGHTRPVQYVCFSVDCCYVLVCVGCVGLIYRVKVSVCACMHMTSHACTSCECICTVNSLHVHGG